jgi:hypothetical protein
MTEYPRGCDTCPCRENAHNAAFSGIMVIVMVMVLCELVDRSVIMYGVLTLWEA